MTKKQPAATHPKAAPDQLLSSAMATLNGYAPALFLYAPSNTAVVSRRIENVEIDPYSWASGLREWRADGP